MSLWSKLIVSNSNGSPADRQTRRSRIKQQVLYTTNMSSTSPDIVFSFTSVVYELINTEIALASPNLAMIDMGQYLSHDLTLRKGKDSMETFCSPWVNYPEAVESSTITTAASFGGTGVSAVPVSLRASISVTHLAELDGYQNADIISLPVLGANEQMKDCVSIVEMLPNTSELIAADLVFQHLVLAARKSIFISQLWPRIPKEAIVKYLRNELSEDDVRKCSVFKFSFARRRDIASFKIIAPAAQFERIMSTKVWPRECGHIVRLSKHDFAKMVQFNLFNVLHHCKKA
uniref:Uncharacterized protein n=1 Tax=Glossina palpalis gambiensis TaxID=67801 RepID=A0A1B0BY90_9MUSC